MKGSIETKAGLACLYAGAVWGLFWIPLRDTVRVNLLDRKDADEETITRKRGGLVASVIKGRPKYMDKLHIIMPAKNNRGEMRFHYKNQLGKKVLKNIIR